MSRKKRKKKVPAASKDTEPISSEPESPEVPTEHLPLKERSSAWQQTVVVEFSELVYLRAIFFITAILGSLYLTYYMRSVLTPILFAWLLAYFFRPAVQRIESWGGSRSFSIFLVMGLLGLIGLISLIVVIPALSRSLTQISDLFSKVPDLLHSGRVWVETKFSTQVPATWTEVFRVWGTQIKSFTPKFIQAVSLTIAGLFSSGMDFLIGLFHVILVPLFMYYFLYDFDAIKDRTISMIPHRYSGWFQERFKHIDMVLSGYIRGQLIVCLLVASLYLLLLVPLKIPGAPILAIIGGVINVVPYVGFLSVFFVSLMVSVIEFQFTYPFFLVLVGMSVIHLIDIFFITPKVVGEQLGVSELVVILAILFGGHLFGMIGVLLAVPVAAVGKVILEELVYHYRESHFFLGTKDSKAE